MMSNDEKAEGRIIGALSSADQKGVVTIEDRLGAEAADIWSALTEADRLARWLGEIKGDLRLGGEFSAHFLASGWEGTGRVETCEQMKQLVVVTKQTDGEDEHRIEVRLTADGDSTLVVWEERDLPLDMLAGYGAGIQIHVEDLVDHLSGLARRDPAPRFAKLYPSYQRLAAAVS